MIQRGDCPGLTLKAFRKSFFGSLDGNGSIETRIAGFVHFAHTAGSDGVQNLVGAAAGSRGKGHIWPPTNLPANRSASRSSFGSSRVSGSKAGRRPALLRRANARLV